MSLNDRFTQIQHKSKIIGEDELARKHRMLSFNMERRPEVAASLMLNQDYISRERLRVPLPPLPPPRPEIGNHIYNSVMMIRPSERLGVPVHERLALGSRVPVVEDRRRIRRRRGTKNRAQEPAVVPNVNANGSNNTSTNNSRSRNRKKRSSKQKDPFPRKEHVYSKEDLDQQLDQFMSHTKQKRDEELNKVIQEHT